MNKKYDCENCMKEKCYTRSLIEIFESLEREMDKCKTENQISHFKKRLDKGAKIISLSPCNPEYEVKNEKCLA